MDQKISQLTALTTADQADVYAIVDTSATETKKITQENLEDTIANSTNFVDELVGNSYFTTELANDANFVNELTLNSSFQSAVNNFVTTVPSSGSGSGGKPITFSLTDTVTATSNPLSGYSDAEAVVYSNGSTIYMQDAIGYTQSRDTSTDWASSTTVVSYVLLNAYAYVLLSSGAALRVYRYNRNDLSAGGTLVTFSGATLTYGANVVMTSNGVQFFFNYNVGQSANSYSIAKLTISGTTLTYISATSAGSTANQFSGAFAVDSVTNYYGTNAGVIYQYDNTGTLQVTSGSTLATISRLFNWDNTLYGCDSAGQFFNKLYMQDTDLSGGGSGNKLLLDTTVFNASISGAAWNTAYTIPVTPGTLSTNNALRISLINPVFTTSANLTLGIRVSYGGTVVGTVNTVVPNATPTPLDFKCLIAAKGTTNSQVTFTTMSNTVLNSGGIGQIINGITADKQTSSVDSTVSQNLVIEFSSVNFNTIDFYCDGVLIEKIS